MNAEGNEEVKVKSECRKINKEYKRVKCRKRVNK
jgi:hypothetical protein